MNQEGQISGANWGSYPATSQIWMKDMYYAFLPFSILEPDLFKKGILWFLKYGIRPKGGRFDGGVYHSLTNSLSSVIMAGLYYEYTGDTNADYDMQYDVQLQKAIEVMNEKLK